jgi:hypothetical protein
MNGRSSRSCDYVRHRMAPRFDPLESNPANFD